MRSAKRFAVTALAAHAALVAAALDLVAERDP
jgi:hypothetical protein